MNDVATSTVWTANPLDEAAAIVEAEWLRLQWDGASAAPEAVDPPAEAPSGEPNRAHVGVATHELPSGSPVPADRGAERTWRRPAMWVWPTQRSPP